MTTIFSSIDILSPLVSDKFFSVAKNKSKFGALCSLIFFVILIIGIQRSFSELLARDAPSIQSSEKMNEDPMKLVISPDRFPLSFYVALPSALGTRPFKSDSIYTLEVYHLVRYNEEYPNGTVTRKQIPIPLQLEECTKEYAGEHASKFDNYDFTGSHCISKNQSNGFDVNNLQIQGRYSLNTYQALAVIVKPCIPKVDPITNLTDNSTCASPELIKKYLTGAWFTVGYFNHLPTLQNFERPLDVYIDDHTTIISPNAYKQLFIEVGYVEVTTDSGLIFENKHKDTSFKITEIDDYLDPNPSSDQVLITCLIQSGQKETYYSRSYKKFQSTLADIGGLANAILGIILVLATPYLKFKARENLMNNVFTVNDEPKFEKGKPEKKKKKNKKQSSMSQSSKSENTKIFEEQRTLKSLYITREESPSRPLQSPTGEETFLKGQSDKSLSPQVKRSKDDDRILSMSDLKAFSETSKYEKQIGPLLGLRKIISETSKLMNEDPIAPCMSPTDPAKAAQAEENQSKRIDKSDIENQLEEYDVVKAKKTGKFLGDLVEDIHLDDPSQHIQENEINIEIADPKDSQTEAKPSSEVKEQEKNLEEKEKEEEQEEENSKQMINLKQKEVHLKLWEYAVSLVHKPKSKSSKIATVQAGVKNIDQRLELSNILKKLSEVDKLILLMLDSDQLELFNSIPKPKLLQRSSPSILRKNSFETSFYRKATMEDYQPDEKNLMTAYRNLKSKENKTEIDKKLIDIFQKKVQ